MQIVINTPFTYKGQLYQRGEPIVDDETGQALVDAGLASFKVPSPNRNVQVKQNEFGDVVSLVTSNGQEIGQVKSPIQELYQPRTIAGSYTGNGTTQSINLGFRPDLVIVKGNTTQYCIFNNNVNFQNRNDHFLNIASFAGQFGVTKTESGFTVGNDNRVNANAVTYYYFAYCDNGSKAILQANWQGNALAGRTVDMLEGNNLQGAIIKRDSPQGAVFVVADKSQNFFFNGSTNAVSTGTTLNSETGVFTLGSGNEVNQWAGILGEGTNCLAFSKNSEATAVFTYTGTGAARKITLPFEPEFFIIAPRSVSVATTRAWFSSLPAGNLAPLTNLAVGTGDSVTVTKNTVSFGSSANNNTGVEYVMYAIKRIRTSSLVPLNNLPVTKYKSVELDSTGYIDCGTSNTLAVTGDLTMEWYGVVYNPDSVQYTASATIDTDAGNQDKLQPLLFRSNGLDTTNAAVNYGMAILAPQVSTDTDLQGCILMICTHDNWGLLQSTSGNLDNNPMNTGFVIDTSDLVHIVATHRNSGNWVVYVNGVPIKERKRDLLASIGRPSVQGYSGMTTVIGARRRSTIDNANGMSVKLVRIYNKTLTPKEVQNNYLSLFGKATATTGFIEEWDAEKATGTTLPATVNPANNGTITNGTLY